jgi:cysteine desulfurase
MRRVYMDSNATTPLLPEVLGAMSPYYLEQFGNASSIHHHGQQARAAVERARESVAKLLNCRAAEIVFTSGGTESDNLALFGLLYPHDGESIHVITSTIEHHAVLNAFKALEERGVEVTYVDVDQSGRIHPDSIQAALRPDTRLVSIMMANNETGVLQPVEEIGELAKEHGILFHTDAVQAAAKVPIDVNKIGCHALSISGHKMHAPQGVGALYVRKGILIHPMLVGGNHERQRRAGTENLAGIVGLGKAADIALDSFANGSISRIAAMRDRLESNILSQIEDTGLNGEDVPRVPNTTNIHIDHIEGEALVIALDLKGLAVSTGAACSSGAIEPSHVLTAMGLRPAQSRSSIRFSFGKHNSEADVDFALSILPETVARLRELSPVYNKKNKKVALGR